jgi:hypothetical protein
MTAMSARVSKVAILLLVCACKKSTDVTPAPVMDAGSAASTAASAEADAQAMNPAAGGSATTTALASTPTTELADAGDVESVAASAVIAVPGGALLVYAIANGDKSDIIGHVLDVEGRRRGSPHLLRRTSGSIGGLSIAARDGVVWIAWGASIGSDEKHLAAAIKTNATLDSVSAPITLVHETLDGGMPNHWAHVLALPSGGAIVATRAAGQAIRCMFAEHQPNEHCRAPGYKVIHVLPDGRTTLLAHRSVDGNPLELAPLVDIGGAVAVRAWAWHGGAMQDDRILAYDDAITPPTFAFSFCNPPYAQAWTGAELITLCANDFPDGQHGERCPDTKELAACPRVLRSPADGGVTDRRGSLVRAVEDACVDGHPVARIVRADGTRTTIDPTSAGAAFPRFAGWTGKVLLDVPHDSTDGARLVLVRRKCRGTELVPIE